MARDGNETRERLIDAAEEVFAVQGVEQANLRDINRAAGQANNSALHYHFGSRAALLAAVRERHQARLSTARKAALADLESAEATIEDLLGASVWALGSALDTPSGRHYVRIMLHIRSRSAMRSKHSLAVESSEELREIYGRLDGLFEHLPEPLRSERLAVWIDMSMAALASRAEGIDAGETPELDTQAFLTNLVDMGAAALRAPSRVPAASH